MIASSPSLTVPDVALHYDELNPYYLGLWGEHVHHGYWKTGRESSRDAVIALSHRVIALAGINRRDMRVCDIGCGYGATSRLLTREYAADVVGLTVSSAQRDHAQSLAKSADRIEYRLENWLENRLPTGSFDAALAIESTEHMPDLRRCYEEAARVLKPGGHLVICAWVSRENPVGWEKRFLLDPICREGRLFQLATEAEHKQLLSDAGFRGITSENATRRVERTWSLCVARTVRAFLFDREARRFLLDSRRSNRVFALTIARLRFAYAIGAMRYHIIGAQYER